MPAPFCIRTWQTGRAVGLSLFACAVLACLGAPARAERIKDIATVNGVRTNQLVGYGLVVGLDGTGDQTSQAPFTIQSITNMLAKFGITIPANANPQLKNVAAVTVTAKTARAATPASRPVSPVQPPTSRSPRNTSGAKPNTIRKNCSTSL